MRLEAVCVYTVSAVLFVHGNSLEDLHVGVFEDVDEEAGW